MQSRPIRNRIKGHRRVRAGDLIPHVWNFRTHPKAGGRGAAGDLRGGRFCPQPVGMAYGLPDGRLKVDADRRHRPRNVSAGLVAEVDRLSDLCPNSNRGFFPYFLL